MMAEDTIQLMDYLNVKEAHLVGVSMGGLIVQEIATRYPERVCEIDPGIHLVLSGQRHQWNNARHVRGR